MSVGKNIKNIRQSKSISREDLSKALNLSIHAIAKYEQGQREPNIDTLNKIAAALDVSVNDLLGTSENFESDFDTSQLGNIVQNYIMMWRDALNNTFKGKYFTNTDIVRNLLIDVIAKDDARSEMNKSSEHNISTLFMVMNNKPVDPEFLYKSLKESYLKDLREEKKQALIPYIHEAKKVVSQGIELTDHLKEAVLEYYEDWFIERIPPQFKKYFHDKIDKEEQYKEMKKLNEEDLALYKEDSGPDIAGYYEDIKDKL